MDVKTREAVERLVDKHPSAASSLWRWYEITVDAEWRNLHDVRTSFRSADAVRLPSERTVVIFNIGGNNFRLITTVDYAASLVRVRLLLTHTEYDKEKWKRTL